MNEAVKKPTVGHEPVHRADPGFVMGNIGWFRSDAKGTGIMALKDIKTGTIIDRNPVVVMPRSDLALASGDEPVLMHYLFCWGGAGDETSPFCAMACGMIVLCNHSAHPNTDMKIDYDAKTIELIASRDIAEGEEITWDYDCDLWFDPQE